MAQKTSFFDLFVMTVKNDREEDMNLGDLLLNQPIRYKVSGSEGSIILLDKFRNSDGMIVGTVAHNQHLNLPSYHDDDTGDTGDLPIPDTAGLAHSTILLYDPILKILAVESKQKGVSITQVCRLFERNYSLAYIHSELVINPLQMVRIDNLTEMTSFNIRVAKVTGGELLTSSTASNNQIINAAHETNANILEVKLGMGYSRNSGLNRARIREFIRSFLPFIDPTGGEVERLEVRGYDETIDDDKIQVIDLVQNRERIKIQYESTRFDGQQLLNQKYGLLLTRYNARRGLLRQAYGS